MDRDPSPRFSLSLLGRFKLTGPGGVVDLPSKKLAGLLTYLACTSPRPQRRETLSALLWGSHFDLQAKQNLRQALFRLRKVLGQDALEGDGEVVSLNPAAVSSDVGRFEALVRDGSRDALTAAAELYRGPLVDDVAVSEEGWSEWLTAERERLLELALGAMVGLGEQDLTAGRAEQALKAGQRAIALHSMREDAHRLIVQALAAAGRKAEALKHYEDLVALLRRELNTEPDAATKSLVAGLRSTPSPSRSPTAEETAKPRLPDRASMEVRSFADRGPEQKADAESQARSDAASSAVPVRSGSPERRQLTVMACSMIGSPLLAGLDPEDISDQISRFRKAVAEVMARFDGFVAQSQGDGELIYFGYPAAHEHDAEQAVRAGLALTDLVGSLKVDAPLRARVGIATGLVVVGEQATGDTRQHIAIGEAPSLAAQLQAVAAPGEVVIAASTRRLVGRMFDCRVLAANERDGLPPSVEAWQARGENAGIGRFEARRAATLSPLVGRREEMELLLRRWNQAKLGEGRVVLLCGEPGIGKSRIAESLLTKLEGEPHARLRYFCSPHRTHSALHPFIAQLERAAKFEPGSSASAKLDRLEALLRPMARKVPRDLALIADLLSVPTEGRYPPLAVTPQQKREMTLAALLDQLEGSAARSPVLIVFEDVHWIDPTSLDLLDRTIARVPDLPALLVVTFRPEFQPPWVGQPHVTMLSLSRLGRHESAGIIVGVAKGKALPDPLLEQVLARADGVPLFIEELTSTLLEGGLLRETTESYVLDRPLPPLAIPTTLQASLVSRLDRLGSVKDVAQIGAVIGREFSYELLGAVAPLAPADLDGALERLTASGLVSRRGAPPIATYSFKHALVQDAAYDTLLKSRRRQLHASIAKVLVERFPGLTESLPEVVAQHFTEAALASEAIDYWRKAGQLASARSANQEAVSCFEQALTALSHLPETHEALEQGVDLRFNLATSLFPLGEFERIFECLREAERLARTLEDQRRLGQLSVYMCRNLWMTGRPTDALAFGQNARTIAESLGDVALQVTGNLYLGVACHGTGDHRQAEELLRRVVQWLEGDRSRERFGQTAFPAVSAHGYLSWALTDQGKFKEGIAQAQEGIRLAEALDHPFSLAIVCWNLGYLRIARGEFSQGLDLHERGLELSRESNLTYFAVLHTGSLGYAYALCARIAEGIPLLERALSATETMGFGIFQPLFRVCLGEAHVLAGRLEDALAFADRALTLSREGGQRAYEAWALRLLGDIAARSDSPEHAEGHYREALALAEGLAMRPLVAHCHLGLGKLYRHKHRLELSQQHLTAASAMYREMDMRFWLEQAEAETGLP